MSLKGKIPSELKIQAVEDYLAIRKGSTQIREELGIRLSAFQAWLPNIRWRVPAGLSEKAFYKLSILTEAGGSRRLPGRRRLAGCHVPQIRDFFPCGFTAMDYVI